MLDLPSLAIDDANRLCDWVELSCLLDDGIISRSDVEDVLHNSGLLDEPESNTDDPTVESVQDVADRMVEFVWSVLGRRAEALGRAYPFEVDATVIMRRAATWQSPVAYTTLLIADLGRFYEEVHVAFEAGGPFPRLFEKIVQASKRGLFGGPVSRFGVPKEPDWPTSIFDRVKQHALEMDAIEERFDGKVEATDGDLGLDIAARLSIAGDYEGTLVILTQCATGENWQGKKGEPSLELWTKLIDWRAKVLRAIALPWRADDPVRIYILFDAIVLDRPRLSAGSPDTHLDPQARDPLVEWCTTRFAEFPRLSA